MSRPVPVLPTTPRVSVAAITNTRVDACYPVPHSGPVQSALGLWPPSQEPSNGIP